MARQKQPSRKRAAEDEGESAGNEPQNKKIKHQFAVSKEPKQDDDGNQYWEISNKRRVQVSEYKGTTLISLREYYEKDGKTLPGKGISLTVEQFNALSELLPELEKVLREKDLKVTRPQYPDSQSRKPIAKLASKFNKEDANDDDESDTVPMPSAAKSKLSKFKLKANHEATSDEDD